MDNADQLGKQILKAVAYLIFVFPFVWVWRKLTGSKAGTERPDDDQGES
ncbi:MULTISPECIES: hypothetical protein [Pseudohongiella]|uniref:Uncharacterized protein n=1 Tax=marine sediment metagenome TaxID=412755 RepID=A0A0F9Y4P6_9ZZZZ|nr:hypothetical protein [Pseudohongiella sp.]